MPADNSSTVRPAIHSIARDLGEQFKKFHGASIEQVPDVWDDENRGLVAIVPEGKSLVSVKKYIDEYRERPERVIGTARHLELASFVAHVNLFKDAHSAIFADPTPTAPKVLAVLDYNESQKNPRFGKHRSAYDCPLSEEWKVWTANDGESMTQADFAAFIEDHVGDVVLPDQKDDHVRQLAELLESRWAGPSGLVALSRNLAVNVETQVQQAVTLSSGEISVKYSEQHKDGAGEPIKVANLFMIAVPVFRAGDLYRIPVRLRYRSGGGRITWSYSLWRADRSLDDAFKGIVEKVRIETGLPVFVGTPEA